MGYSGKKTETQVTYIFQQRPTLWFLESPQIVPTIEDQDFNLGEYFISKLCQTLNMFMTHT